jgi:N-acetylglutamate synthase-like GNAT family acetyltransferase
LFEAEGAVAPRSLEFGFEFAPMISRVTTMNSSTFRVRRATLDDISQLAALWNSMKFPADALSKRVTEFQVAENPEGVLVGAVGLEIAQKQGRIHSEAFTDFALADQLRPMLWDRIHAVATNHGLLRLWTQEHAPFWSHCGLVKPDPDALEKLPVPWQAQKSEWFTLKLKDDIEKLVSLDKEFALFMDSEKQRTAKAFQHAKILKLIATLIALGVFIIVLIGAFMIFKRGGLPPR